MLQFRWNRWNIDHIAEHGIAPAEAQAVVRGARAPYPEFRGNDKWRVCGPTPDGRYLHIVFIFDPEYVVYVIHARDATDGEKRRLRKRRR